MYRNQPKMTRTVSLCISADSICKYNKNIDQLTHAVYEISRSACMFKISEIILLNNNNKDNKYNKNTLIVASLLQFFITPRYLVKETFSNAFKNGTIPKNIFNKAKTLPLIPTIMEYLQPGINKDCNYREGISINKNVTKHRRKNADGKVLKIKKSIKTTKFVQIGSDKIMEIKSDNNSNDDEGSLPLNVRVTVDMKEKKVVGFKEAWGDKYCGYSVRICNDIIGLFTEVNTKLIGEDGYDMSILVKTCDFFNKKKTDDTMMLKEVSREDVKEKEHIVVVVVPKGQGQGQGQDPDQDENANEDVFDGTIRVPAGARVEEGCIVALGVVCHW